MQSPLGSNVAFQKRETLMQSGRLVPRLFCALCLLVVALPATSRAQECKDDFAVTGFRVRSVKLEAFWSRTPQLLNDQLAGHQGDVYANDKGAAYVNEVRTFLAEHPSATDNVLFGVNKLSKLSIDAKFYTRCLIVVPAPDCEAQFKNDPAAPVKNCIDVVVKTKALHLDVINTSSNVLPIPRTNRLIFFKDLPAPLVALQPSFTLDQDRRAGTSVNFGISTDLLDLGQTFTGNTAKRAAGEVDRNTQLRLDLQGSKSINESFYDSEARLSLIHTRPTKLIDSLAVEASFIARERPRGEGIVLKNILTVGGSFALTPTEGAISRVVFGGRYRRASNRFFSGDGSITELTDEDAYEGRLIADGHIRNGFTRFAIWFDGGSPKRFNESYQRLAGIAGYEKEIPVALNQTIGVELIVGGGRSWGLVPEYERFYGGSRAGSFLYDNPQSATLSNFPTGPLLRSFGQQQAGIRTANGTLRGGTSYWHSNLNITIPIGPWSRPLIPAEQVAGTATLKTVMKNQIKQGKAFYILAVARQKLTPEQQQALRLDDSMALTPEQRERLKNARAAYTAAQATVTPEADKIWNEITPITNFVADQANLYSIKPLIMFDAARLKAGESFNNRTRYALGGGFQLTVVIAKFELGYMHTLNRISGDNSGNVVARLVFQNLF
jgi:Surface antigen.